MDKFENETWKPERVWYKITYEVGVVKIWEGKNDVRG
jgi:hypothetical protein